MADKHDHWTAILVCGLAKEDHMSVRMPRMVHLLAFFPDDQMDAEIAEPRDIPDRAPRLGAIPRY